MKRVAPGSTDVPIDVFVPDASSTTGGGLTGLTYDSSGLTLYYHRPGAAAVQITLVSQTVTGAHSDGGFCEISAAGMPGVYRIDLPDAVVAAGVRSVSLMLQGAADMAPVPIEIDLAETLEAIKSVVDQVLEDTAELQTNQGNWLTATSVTVSDKTGFKLASDGLDSITATEPTGKPTTFPGWVMWLVQRFRRAAKSTTEITVKTEAGADVTTQTITDDGAGTETLGPPS